jgi:hypothetical protein
MAAGDHYRRLLPSAVTSTVDHPLESPSLAKPIWLMYLNLCCLRIYRYVALHIYIHMFLRTYLYMCGLTYAQRVPTR